MHLRPQRADAFALKQSGLDLRESLVWRLGVSLGFGPFSTPKISSFFPQTALTKA
jgi:hypothetical protein